ncbi:MAG: hypothetical protein ACYDBH_02970 [Acidobacteriaceae bacterium]
MHRQTQYREQQIEQALSAVSALPGNRKAALLTHKPMAEAIIDRKESRMRNVLIGWWGRDERGHNEWVGRNLVIFGCPYMRTEDQASRYESARVFALLSGADPADWPAWTSDVEPDTWINEGEVEVRSIPRLPTNPQIRTWLLTHNTASVVQAVGRVRGVWMPHDDPGEIHIYGGLPLSGLGEYGLSVEEYRDDPTGWRTRDSYNKSQSEDARTRFLIAAEGLAAVGDRLTFRGINGFLHAAGQRGLNPRAYARWRAEAAGGTSKGHKSGRRL